MNTLFLLLAEFETSIVPLEKVADKYLGLSKEIANRKADKHQLPFVAHRLGSQKSGYQVHVKDLAKWLDSEWKEARRDWQDCN